MLDHILLGCSDLDRGIAFVEQRTGVKAAFGGVHPGRGTRNALLSLGEMHYLEIIAPDPQQVEASDVYGVNKLTEPRLVCWAAHPGPITQFAAGLRNRGLAFEAPFPAREKAPMAGFCSGRLCALKTTTPKCCRSSSSGTSAPFIPPPTRPPVAKSIASRFPVQTTLNCSGFARHSVSMFASNMLKNHNSPPTSPAQMES
jgi:hypothetical protein